MIRLLDHINYRNIQLTHTTVGETVKVRHISGNYRYIRWLGFIERKTAKNSVGTPVAISVDAYSLEDMCPRWIKLEGKHVQGCLFKDGVYAVVDSGIPRIIP